LSFANAAPLSAVTAKNPAKIPAVNLPIVLLRVCLPFLGNANKNEGLTGKVSGRCINYFSGR
ncbi:hypothetical protein, partial [Klebsiella pneumoniae]|uniref:hypothetical protein n=1 Tax=Klebsiella pneumoniae TaxID=573 RepID=UPI001954F6C4